MKRSISDDELKQALSLFRESVHQFRPAAGEHPSYAFTSYAHKSGRFALAAFAMALLLAALLPVYRYSQTSHADAAGAAASVRQSAPVDDDALLRAVESEVSRSVPPPMQPLELLMASETVTSAERSK